MIKARHTHEEFVTYLESTSTYEDLLCCVMNEAWKCALCARPVCVQHLHSMHYCKRCETFLLKYD